MDRMSTKVKGRIGPGYHDLKVMRVLNRVVEWTDHGIQYEADQRHAELLIEMLNLKDAKGVDTPGINESKSKNSARQASVAKTFICNSRPR